MKLLKNKETGELGKLVVNVNKKNNTTTLCVLAPDSPLCGNSVLGEYDSLSELCDKWEDYEGDKPWKPRFGEEYWFVRNDGKILTSKWDGYKIDEYRYSVGNCFRTEEETEQALEKLKAWKRLQDAGFKFDGLDKDRYDYTAISTNLDDLSEGAFLPNEINKDLDLLFGGEG